MTLRGSCHCGDTQFEVSEAPAGLTRCTCSLCSKRGGKRALATMCVGVGQGVAMAIEMVN